MNYIIFFFVFNGSTELLEGNWTNEIIILLSLQVDRYDFF